MRFSHTTSAALFLAIEMTAAASGLEITVHHSVNGSLLLLDSLRYSNAAKETLSFTRVSYLLSGFALQREDGTWLEMAHDAWFDAGKRRATTLLPGVVEGRYRALRFYVGPSAATNTGDPAQYAADHPLNPNLNGLHWSWQTGYIFLAVEGHYRSGAGEIQGYAYHFARDPNRTRVTLAAPLDLTHDAAVVLDFDLGTLINAPRPLSFARDGAATHSRDGDPVAGALAANLPGAFRIAEVLSSAPAEVPVVPVKPLYLPEKYTPFRFTMNATFPRPALPRDNPLLEERVALGKVLFGETALSRDGAISCSSCHVAASAFADPRPVSIGVQGKAGTRNAMPLFNLAWKHSFFWDGRAPSLRAQVLEPIQDHLEMDETLPNVVAKLEKKEPYPAMFRAAFGSPEVTAEKLGLAMEAFMLSLVAGDAKIDRAMRGTATLTEEEKRGFELFMTENDPRTRQRGADCFHCHGGPLFSDHDFHNNGLPPDPADTGRFRVTHNEADKGKFSTPSLRNIALTAPYMHDGRFTTLEEVVAHYSTGVKRSSTLDPNLAKHPDGGLHLTADEQRALVAFLRALTSD